MSLLDYFLQEFGNKESVSGGNWSIIILQVNPTQRNSSQLRGTLSRAVPPTASSPTSYRSRTGTTGTSSWTIRATSFTLTMDSSSPALQRILALKTLLSNWLQVLLFTSFQFSDIQFVYFLFRVCWRDGWCWQWYVCLLQNINLTRWILNQALSDLRNIELII